MKALPPIEIDPRTFLREHHSLPAIPSVVLKLQEILNSENVSVGKVANLISRDPALTAQVLKIVNSAYYSLPREIAEVNLAVAFLGIHEVYRIVLSISVINALSAEKTEEFNTIWIHSVYTALCAKFLTQKFEPLLPVGEIWTAAILHDIGKLVYLKFFPEHFKALQTRAREKRIPFHQAEEATGNPSSAYMGSLLCDHWRLPEPVREACRSHSLPDLERLDKTNGTRAFNRIVCLSNLVSSLSSDNLSEPVKQQYARAIRNTLDITESEFLLLMGSAYELGLSLDRFS